MKLRNDQPRSQGHNVVFVLLLAVESQDVKVKVIMALGSRLSNDWLQKSNHVNLSQAFLAVS